MRVLLISDGLNDGVSLERQLARKYPALRIHQVGAPDGLAQALAGDPLDLAIWNAAANWCGGGELSREVKARWPQCPVIGFSNAASEGGLTLADRAGLDDFVQWANDDVSSLLASVAHALGRVEERQTARQTEKRYRAFFDEVPIGLFTCRADGVFVQANPALLRVLGYPDLASLQLADPSAIYLNDRDREQWQAEAQSGEYSRVEVALRRSNGRTIWCRIAARVFCGAGEENILFEGSLEDVTAEHAAREELRRAQARETALLATMSDGLMVADLRTRELRFVNPAFCRLLDYSQEELLRLKLDDVHPKDQLGRLLKSFEDGRGLPQDLVCVRRNGTQVYAEVSPARELQTGRRMLVALYRDVTELKQSDRKLREIAEAVSSARSSDAFIQSFAANLANVLEVDLIVVAELVQPACDQVRVIAGWSDGAPMEKGLRPLAGTPCEKVLERRLICVARRAQDEFPDDPLLKTYNIESYLGVSLRDSADQPIGTICALHRKPFQDVKSLKAVLQIFATSATADMERRKAENRLRESEELFRALAENTPDALFLLDLEDPTCPAKIIYANEAAALMHGCKIEEIIGQSIAALDDPQTASHVAARVERLRAGEILRFEGFHRRKDGSIFPVEVVARPMMFRSRRAALAIDREITEPRRQSS